MKLVTAKEMQELDRTATMKYGIPSLILMENAGHNTFLFMEEILGQLAGKTVIFFIGPGNNGGDGLVVARKLYQAGGWPILLSIKPLSDLKGDAATNATIIRRLGISSFNLCTIADKEKISEIIFKQHASHPVVCLIDALFGIGLDREVTGLFAEAINWINQLRTRFGWPVLAIDLPSGMETDTGKTMGTAVTADLTVTYALAKPAHFLHGGERIGKLRIVDIDIPVDAVNQLAPAGQVLHADTISLPTRDTNSHKGSHGHLLVLAGSTGMTGAAILCCRAALRCGCGLVTAAVPHNLNLIFETTMPEVMTIPLPSSTDVLSMDDYPLIMDTVVGKNAVVLGPGLGRDKKTAQLVKNLYREVSQPMVVDADALNILSSDPDFPFRGKGPRILTPHPGEMKRLTGLTIKGIEGDRIRAALNISRKCAGENHLNSERKPAVDNNFKKIPVHHAHNEVIIVLKGAGTVIATNNGKWAINSNGNPGLASGGMGDVLAGAIGSLLARQCSPWQAACTAVYLHGLAADMLADKTGYGFTPSEVADQLPAAIRKQKTEDRGQSS